MDDDEKVIITPAEAESLLHDGSERIHNFVQAGPVILGCDYDRDRAIEAFKNAKWIEIGGDGCKGMKHPIVVVGPDGRASFFEADMAKVAAFEAARQPLPSGESQ